jgi:hypothetical protein
MRKAFPEKEKDRRRLLATMTNEPFQPVRLYYSIPDFSFVIRKLGVLKCMVEVPPEGCWQWLFHAEAASLKFGAGYDAVPKERRPIVLGRLRFPKNGGMTIQTNSIQRAIGAAQFFAPRLGPEVVPMRVRVVNRCFAADEGQPDELMKILDQDVTVVDPREAEALLERAFKGVRTREDAERAAAAFVERRLASKQDIPMVEDFPLDPAAETHEFKDLTNTLMLRLVRAAEHWRGNTHLTLDAIIVRALKELHPELS